MKKLILIRHGECAGNIEGRFRGREDFPLNEQGIKQAEETAEYLKNFDFKRVYTSPLKRASKTAEIIATRNQASIIQSEAFNNISLGHWNGRLKSEIKKEHPKEFEIWLNNPEELRVDQLENLNDVRTRATQGIYDLHQLHPDETIIVVSHRAVIKPIIAGLLNISPPWFWKLHLDNASLNLFNIGSNDQFMLTKLNYTEHLTHFVTELF